MTDLAVVQPHRAGGMTDIASSRQAQEVQAAMVVAQRFPRDTTRALTRIMEDCKRKSLADKAVYSYPRGGQTISGPSIRLAETIARAWGNLDFGVVELDKKPAMGNLPGESTVLSYCWDLETNTRSTKVFTVKHWRDTKKGGHALTDERDLYEIVANNGARRLRACILAVIPIDIVESAVEQCEKTMEGGQGPLVDRVRSMVLFFKDTYSVTQEMIEKRLGHKIETCSETELVGLKKIANSLKDNFGKREDFFEVSDAQPQDEKTVAPPQEVKSIKNFAPQTSEEAAEINKKIEQKQSAQVEAGPSRAEMGKRIFAAQKRLTLSQGSLGELVQGLFNKQAAELSNDEMEFLMNHLEQDSGVKGN